MDEDDNRALDEMIADFEDVFIIGVYGGRALTPEQKKAIVTKVELRLHDIECRWRRARRAARAAINQAVGGWGRSR